LVSKCRLSNDPTNSRGAQLARGADIGSIGFLFFFIIVVASGAEAWTAHARSRVPRGGARAARLVDHGVILADID
jgi:hypothetical protein